MRTNVSAITIAIGALLLAGCAGVPPTEQKDKDYIAYLIQRIETLEQRTERNEYAVVGLSRRVSGLANMVNAPQPQYQQQHQPEPFSQRREVNDEHFPGPKLQQLESSQVKRRSNDETEPEPKPSRQPSTKRKSPKAGA